MLLRRRRLSLLLDQYDMHGKGVNNMRDRKNENNLTTIIRSRPHNDESRNPQHSDGQRTHRHTKNPFEHLTTILFRSVSENRFRNRKKKRQLLLPELFMESVTICVLHRYDTNECGTTRFARNKPKIKQSKLVNKILCVCVCSKSTASWL